MLFDGFEDEDGNLTNIAYADGYWFGDRLLEGVMFKYEISPSGELSAAFMEENAYTMQLNREFWLSAAREYAESGQSLYATATGGTDVYAKPAIAIL